MTRNNTNGKLRAVFLAALMFLWVFAGTVAFAGGAAAAVGAGNVEYQDANGATEAFAFQGQDRYVVLDDADFDDGDSVSIAIADDFETSSGSSDQIVDSTFVEQVTLEDPSASGYDGDYTASASGNLVAELDTDDYDAGRFFVDEPEIDNVRDNTLQVGVQDLDSEFDEDEVTDSGPESTAEFDLTSNRGTYSINASAEGDIDE